MTIQSILKKLPVLVELVKLYKINNMKVKVVTCSDDELWYKNHDSFYTEVDDAVNRKESLTEFFGKKAITNPFWNKYTIFECYYSPEHNGYILKKDCEIAYDGKEQSAAEELFERQKSAKERRDKIFMEGVRRFASGARRDGNLNKPFVHNLKGYTRLRFGYHMTTGARKYGDKNWELGMPTDQYLESVDRHLAQYLSGDRSEDHLSAIIFGIQGVMINEQKDGIDPDWYFNQTNNE